MQTYFFFLHAMFFSTFSFLIVSINVENGKRFFPPSPFGHVSSNLSSQFCLGQIQLGNEIALILRVFPRKKEGQVARALTGNKQGLLDSLFVDVTSRRDLQVIGNLPVLMDG